MTARLTVCLSFDFDGMCGWIFPGRRNNPSMISRGEFAQVAVPRILDLLARASVPASFAVPGFTALAYPDLMARIRDEGHEILHHGLAHENPADFDEAGERDILRRGIEAIERSAGVRPLGYRSPAWELSPATLSLLREEGFLYESSCMGHDFHPYYLRIGDRFAAGEAYRFGRICDLVELPVYWGLDDYPHFEYSYGEGGMLRDPAEVERIWSAELDFAHGYCPGGLFGLTCHPEFIGRGARLLMLERLIGRMKGLEGVAFSTMADYAKAWKAANPLDDWIAANPRFAGLTALEGGPDRR